jgi:septal ring factor EnvC (AmiA/AmiB activator)
MKFAMTMLASAFFMAAAAGPALAINWPGKEKSAVSTPGEFKDWADDRLERAREDLERFDRRLEGYSQDTRDGFKDNVMKIKERISHVEGEVKAVGDREDKDSWSMRKDAREEINDIRQDVGKLHRKLDKKD